MENEMVFFIATPSPKGFNWTYESDRFRFTELEILHLIKILIVDKRNRHIGRKILSIYEDATEDRREITKERLQSIGVSNGKPERTRNKAK